MGTNIVFMYWLSNLKYYLISNFAEIICYKTNILACPIPKLKHVMEDTKTVTLAPLLKSHHGHSPFQDSGSSLHYVISGSLNGFPLF